MSSSNNINNRILIIDDNHEIHEDFKKVLRPSEGGLEKFKQAIFNEEQSQEIILPTYEITSAFQGEEGFELIKKAMNSDSPFFMAFVDILMPPGWDGIETIQKIWQIDPNIQTVICTAFSDYAWQEMVKKLGMSDRLLILKKPFDSIEVRQIAVALNQKWILLQESKQRMELLQSMVEERTSQIRATLEATTDGILVINNESTILDYNHNFVDIWGTLLFDDLGISEILKQKKTDELIAFMVGNILDSELIQDAFHNLFYNFEEENFIDLRLEIFVKNGRFVELYTRPLENKEGITGKVISLRDVTERKHFEEQLTFQATHDTLTHLPNRMILIDRLHQAISQATRDKEEVIVIFVDLDRFKAVNDTKGHLFGDEILKMVAGRLEQCKRETDTLCRVGGDEFVFIIPNCKDDHVSSAIIQKIHNTLNKPFLLQNNQITLTGSLGISVFPKNGNNADELLKAADTAMYRSKALGKNTFQFYAEEMNVQVRKRLELEQNLYHAYTLGEFLLHYQPVIDLKTQKVIGTEALLRWQHPDLGLIHPPKFLNIAEETGLIVPIGEWVLRTACEQNLRWQKNGIPSMPMSINLSSYQAKSKDAVKMVEMILDELNYPGTLLELEIKENTLMENEEAQKTFQRLQKMGVAFVIDDFGTGYSNLSYLMHYPISKLKIDKSFIDLIDKDPIDAALVKAIILLAHNLKKKIVAEGVETENQIQFLQENNCDEIQGYFYSKPLDAKTYEQFVMNNLKL